MFRQLLIAALICFVARTVQSFKPSFIRQSRSGTVFKMVAEKFEDPNFDAHLPKMLKVGRSQNRPDPDLAKNLRERFKKIQTVKRAAAAALKKSNNAELAIELEELADEFAETEEKFGGLRNISNMIALTVY
jgi:hypothetical protein